MTLSIPTNILKAVSLFASKEETRYYLNGVCVEAEQDAIRLIATDGHRLFTARIDCENLESFEAFIIPSDAIKRALTGNKDESVELAIKPYSLASVSFAPIEGSFPDWRRVAPSEVSGVPSQLNTEYFADFGKAAKFLNGGRKAFAGQGVFIAHNGTAPCVVTFQRDDCIGLLMPMRSAVGESNERALDLLNAHFRGGSVSDLKIAA